MISVAVLINGHPIYARSAVRRSSNGTESCYQVDDGTYVNHKPEDGAVVLAKKLLDTIKEPESAD